MSSDIIRSVTIIVIDYVFMMKTIFVSVNLTAIVPTVCFSSLTSITVTSVCQEEDVFEVIWRLRMISSVFVHHVMKDIGVSLIYMHLDLPWMHFCSTVRNKLGWSILWLFSHSSCLVSLTISVRLWLSSAHRLENWVLETISSSLRVSVRWVYSVYCWNSFWSLSV